MRKIVVLELLSNHRVREFKVKTSIKQTYEMMSGSPNIMKIEMTQWSENLIMAITVRMLFGKRYSTQENHEVEEGKRARKARKFSILLGAFVVADFIPSLRWFDIGGYEKEMKENAKETDCILENWLVEHKRKRSIGERKNEEEKDFMDILLSLFEGALDKDLAGYDADTIIKCTCLAMLGGGTDSTIVTLTWTFSLLLNNPHVMEKAQEELDIQIGRDTLVDESHINKLIYLQAIIKESLCLYPPAPLSAPHESMEDCIVGGYNIPKGTRVLFNLWKIQQDPIICSEPDLSKSERFLMTHKNTDLRGNHFEFIPFGAGRRICPGFPHHLCCCT